MNMWLDFKYALRTLLKSPGYTCLIIAIMALGMGLCIYIYSLIYGTSVKELPFQDAEKMRVINIVDSGVFYGAGSLAISDFIEIRELLQGAEDLDFYQYGDATISSESGASRYDSLYVKASIFRFTGVSPILGRVFNDYDTSEAADYKAVIGYQMWQDFFNGRKDIIGHEIKANGLPTEIIGVMPEGYAFPISHQLWLPMRTAAADLINRDATFRVEAYFKLKHNYSQEQINSQLKTIMARRAQEHPETNENITAIATDYHEILLGNGSDKLFLAAMVSVLFVLMLACINVGNLLLARVMGRAKEIAIRVALGAPKGRLIMQMMMESGIVCFVGGTLAICFAGFGLEFTEAMFPVVFEGPVPYFWFLGIDNHVLIASFVIMLMTTLLTGALPALKVISGDFNKVLRDGTQGAQGKSAARISRVLLTFEVSLSCCLLTVSACLIFTINILTHMDIGVDTRNAFVSHVALLDTQYREKEKQINFFKSLMTQLNEHHDIKSAGIVTSLPGQVAHLVNAYPEGQSESELGRFYKTGQVLIAPGSLDSIGIKLIQGRLLRDSDNLNSKKVAVISKKMAKSYWPEQDHVVGKRFRWAEYDGWVEVIGVVEDVYHSSMLSSNFESGTAYESLYQVPFLYPTIFIRNNNDMKSSQLALDKILASLDRDAPAFRSRSYEDALNRNVAGLKFISLLFNVFALAGLILAASGIYGVMANAIEQRTQEFGIRRALGCPDEDIIKLLLLQGGKCLAIGAIMGMPIAYIIGDSLISIFNISNPWMYSLYFIMPLFIAIVVMISTYIPAVRAIKFEPIVALRYE